MVAEWLLMTFKKTGFAKLGEGSRRSQRIVCKFQGHRPNATQRGILLVTQYLNNQINCYYFNIISFPMKIPNSKPKRCGHPGSSFLLGWMLSAVLVSGLWREVGGYLYQFASDALSLMLPYLLLGCIFCLKHVEVARKSRLFF